MVSQARESRGLRLLKAGFLRPNIRRYNEFNHPDGDRIEEFQRRDILYSPDRPLICRTSLMADRFQTMVRVFAKYVRSTGGREILLNSKSPELKQRRVFDYWIQSKYDIFVNKLIDSRFFSSAIRPLRPSPLSANN
jgi:hypothetical protein